MAGGLGTRMRSAHAEAPAPAARPADGRLGRRGGRAARRPTRSSSSPRPTRRPPSTGSRSRSRSSRSAPATRSRRARSARRTPRRRARALRATRRCSRPSCLARARARPRRGGAAATVLSFVPADPRSYGRIVRGEHGGVVGDRRGRRRDAGAARDRRGELVDLRLPRRRPLAGARAARRRRTRRASCTSPTPCAHSSTEGERVAVHVAADPRETEGVNTRVELAAAAAVLRDRINEAHMLAGVTIVDPASTWIEPTVTLEPDAVDPPVHRAPGGDGGRRGRGGRAARRRGRRVDRPRRAGGTVLLPSPRHRARGILQGRHVRRAQEHALGEGTKVPHLSYMGDAEIGDGTNIGAGSITANFPHERPAEAADGDRP